jgi:hypothetical protein
MPNVFFRTPEARAKVTLSTGLTGLMTDLLDQDRDFTDREVWRPAKRAFLDALIRAAQLELAAYGPTGTADDQRRAPAYRQPVTETGDTDSEGVRRAWCMGTAPHTEHEFNGGMWCPGLTESPPEASTLS